MKCCKYLESQGVHIKEVKNTRIVRISSRESQGVQIKGKNKTIVRMRSKKSQSVQIKGQAKINKDKPKRISRCAYNRS